MDQRGPLVSVIMPVFNAEKTVYKAIQSILSQTHENLELIVIDDASTDSSIQVIGSSDDTRIHTHRNPENIGYLKTVNRAFSLVSGEFVTFQDADDWSSVERLRLQVGFLLKHPNTAVCGTQCQFVEKHKISSSRYPTRDEQIRTWLKRGENSVFCGATLMVRREVLSNIGPFDEQFDRIGSEALDWYLRILKQHRAANLSKHLYFYNQTEGSLSRGISLDPLIYHSAQIAMYINREDPDHDREAAFSEMADVIWHRYEEEIEILKTAGYHQLICGNLEGYLSCGARIREKRATMSTIRFYSWLLPLYLLSRLSVGRRKSLYRLLKLFKSAFRQISSVN